MLPPLGLIIKKMSFSLYACPPCPVNQITYSRSEQQFAENKTNSSIKKREISTACLSILGLKFEFSYALIFSLFICAQ
jgi:hypothetical protein